MKSNIFYYLRKNLTKLLFTIHQRHHTEIIKNKIIPVILSILNISMYAPYQID